MTERMSIAGDLAPLHAELLAAIETLELSLQVVDWRDREEAADRFLAYIATHPHRFVFAEGAWLRDGGRHAQGRALDLATAARGWIETRRERHPIPETAS